MKATPENYAKFVHQIRLKKPNDFYTLFDGGKDFDDALKTAKRNFERLMLPHAERYLGHLSEKESLDIGYGSGFQVLAASEHFKRSIGIDVHTEGDFIYDDFIRRGIRTENMDLYPSEAAHIDRVDESIDFVHSWVVFLHFPSLAYVESTLKEIFRILKPKGVAAIYYPRLVKTKRKETFDEYHIDIELENKHEKGFEANESLTEVFKRGIILARWKMVELVIKIGFDILEHTCSNDGGFVFGQHGIVLGKKPAIVEVESSSTSPSTVEIPYSTPSKPEKKKRLISRKKKSIKKKST